MQFVAMYSTHVNTNCYINSSQRNGNYNFSLLPVKYGINFTAVIETFCMDNETGMVLHSEYYVHIYIISVQQSQT